MTHDYLPCILQFVGFNTVLSVCLLVRQINPSNHIPITDGPTYTHNTYLLTYLLTPWRRVLLEKLTGSAASQEIPHIL